MQQPTPVPTMHAHAWEHLHALLANGDTPAGIPVGSGVAAARMWTTLVTLDPHHPQAGDSYHRLTELLVAIVSDTRVGSADAIAALHQVEDLARQLYHDPHAVTYLHERATAAHERVWSAVRDQVADQLDDTVPLPALMDGLRSFVLLVERGGFGHHAAAVMAKLEQVLARNQSRYAHVPEVLATALEVHALAAHAHTHQHRTFPPV